MQLVFKTFTSDVLGPGFLSRWVCPWLESVTDQDKKKTASATRFENRKTKYKNIESQKFYLHHLVSENTVFRVTFI